MNGRKEETTFSFSAFAAIILNIVFWYFGLQKNIQDYIARKFGEPNLILFVFSVLLFILVFVTTYNIFNRRKERQLPDTPKKRLLLTAFICIICVNAVLLIVQFVNANQVIASPSDNYIWHQIPLVLLSIFLALLFIAFLLVTNRLNGYTLENTKASNAAFWILGIAIALLAGYGEYYPNAGAYHVDAYYTSVYNVSHGTPYSDTFGSIYGHYAVLIAPVLSLARLCGATNMDKVFAFIMAALVFITYILVTYSISVFVKNKSLRFLGVCAMAFTLIAMREELYYQVHPHRTFIIGLTLAMIACMAKHPEKKNLITGIGYALCAFMIIWSTEMGLIATVTWIVFLISQELQTIKLKNLSSWGKIGLYIGLGALSFMMAWGIVSLYNIFSGGEMLTFKGFMYPYLSGIDIVEALSMPLNNMTTSWIFVLFLFLYYLGKGISSTKLCIRRSETSLERAAYLAISVLGLASVTYFVNRPAYFNLDIILAVAVLLLCIMAQDTLIFIKVIFDRKSLQNYSVRHSIAAGFGITAAFILFVLSLGTFVNMGSNLEVKEAGKESASLTELAKQVADNVPPDTKAWGVFIPEVYSILDRDMQLYCTDYPDVAFYPMAEEYLSKELNLMKDEAFFTSAPSMEYIRKFPEAYNAFNKTHCVDNIWNGAGVAFQYYLPLKDDNLITELSDFTLPAGVDSVYEQEIGIEKNTQYYISFQAITDESPTTFIVDFYGENYDIDSCQAVFEFYPEIESYNSKLFSGDMELPQDVYIRIRTQSNRDIEIKNFKIYNG